jgi:hypothetical protein
MISLFVMGKDSGSVDFALGKARTQHREGVLDDEQGLGVVGEGDLFEFLSWISEPLNQGEAQGVSRVYAHSRRRNLLCFKDRAGA